MDHEELIPHLFRTEYRKIVSVLCRHFGFGHIEIAEDIASDTFLAAAQTWGVGGIPQNPTAWLYSVAKNKALNYLRRASIFEKNIVPELQLEPPGTDEPEIDLSPQNIDDSQLRMMFALCHPSIPPEAQIALSLRILCGFGIEEIADAFLTNKETVNKRIFRAKDKLREGGITFELPEPSEINGRLANVLTTIYLLFTEGYYSVSQNKTIRKDLCFEAMRLCTMLVENKFTNMPEVNALLSLMCFHASRFDARVNDNGELILYDEQDTNLWNSELIAKGAYYLHRATAGDIVSKYHVEAAIAYWHTQKSDSHEKWENILQLFNRLLQIDYSPVAALNRTYALSMARGKQAAIAEAEGLQLKDNHFYFMLLGELYTDIDDQKAQDYFRKALSLAKTEMDRKTIQKKIDKL